MVCAVAHFLYTVHKNDFILLNKVTMPHKT